MHQRGFEVISAYRGEAIALPVRQTARSAGYDLASAEVVEIAPNELKLIPTGLKAYMQPDEYLGIHIRSSLAIKKNLALANSVGIIDADYYDNPENEGHIIIAVINHGKETVKIARGERIAQGIFTKYLKADDDTATDKLKRFGGFGSTGA